MLVSKLNPKLIKHGNTDKLQSRREKYILTNHTCQVEGHTLYRIRALKDFAGVRAGELGGYVEQEHNLSQYGNCWICNNAIVYENATVKDNARVSDFAVIRGNAHVTGESSVSESAHISGYVRLSDYSSVFGNANLCGNVSLFDDAIVSGDARISGNVALHGESLVCGLQNLQTTYLFIMMPKRKEFVK